VGEFAGQVQAVGAVVGLVLDRLHLAALAPGAVPCLPINGERVEERERGLANRLDRREDVFGWAFDFGFGGG
jgi:hypothetical protein